MKSRLLILMTASTAAMVASASVSARETARFLNAPAKAVAPAVSSAVQFDLTLRLQGGSDLAQAMLDAGVVENDATTAAQLALASFDEDHGCWDVKISISQAVSSGAFNLVRLRLTSDAGQTVIERRGDKLIIASRYAARKPLRLV